MYNPQGPPYGRYHDPNMPPMDMYNRYHPGGMEMKMPPNRPPPQRYPVSYIGRSTEEMIVLTRKKKNFCF